jgi:hypothetical protein
MTLVYIEILLSIDCGKIVCCNHGVHLTLCWHASELIMPNVMFWVVQLWTVEVQLIDNIT